MIKEKFDLNNKVAVITGSSKGIGKAMAQGLAEFGATVIVSSRKQEAVDEVAKEFTELGLKADSFECHVAKHDQREKLIEKVIEKYGRIDILINNAGTNPYFGPISKMPVNLYQKTMDINVNSAIELSNLVYPYMKKQGGGSIIHISSIEGLHPSAFMAAYNISKTALIMAGKNQSIEWGRHNIRVNSICPGYVKTKLSAALLENEVSRNSFLKNCSLGRVSTPDEMAGLAVFLASDASLSMSGPTITYAAGILNDLHISMH